MCWISERRWFWRRERERGRDEFVGFVKEEERFGWWVRSWVTMEDGEKKKERRNGFDCVWLGLWFYLQNVYVAPRIGGCKTPDLHIILIEFNL